MIFSFFWHFVLCVNAKAWYWIDFRLVYIHFRQSVMTVDGSILPSLVFFLLCFCFASVHWVWKFALYPYKPLMVHENESTDQQNVVTFVTFYGTTQNRRAFTKLQLTHASKGKQMDRFAILKSATWKMPTVAKISVGLNYEFEEETNIRMWMFIRKSRTKSL